MDILPKVICCECLDKIEAFHKFSEEVFALREQYLRRHLHNTVKVEDIAGKCLCSLPITLVDFILFPKNYRMHRLQCRARNSSGNYLRGASATYGS